MKKFIACLLCLISVFCLTSCKKEDPTSFQKLQDNQTLCISYPILFGEEFFELINNKATTEEDYKIELITAIYYELNWSSSLDSIQSLGYEYEYYNGYYYYFVPYTNKQTLNIATKTIDTINNYFYLISEDKSMITVKTTTTTNTTYKYIDSFNTALIGTTYTHTYSVVYDDMLGTKPISEVLPNLTQKVQSLEGGTQTFEFKTFESTTNTELTTYDGHFFILDN